MTIFAGLSLVVIFVALQSAKALRLHLMMSERQVPMRRSFSVHFLANALSILLPFRTGLVSRFLFIRSASGKGFYSLLIILSEVFLDALLNSLLFFVVFVIVLNASFSLQMRFLLLGLLLTALLLLLIPSSFEILKNVIIASPHSSRTRHLIGPMIRFKEHFELLERGLRGHFKLILFLTILAAIGDFVTWFAILNLLKLKLAVASSFETTVEEAFLQILKGGVGSWANLMHPVTVETALPWVAVTFALLSLLIGVLLRRRPS